MRERPGMGRARPREATRSRAAVPAELGRAVERARASGQRIIGLEIGGERYWAKFARGKPWVVQVSKGRPQRVLAREIALLRGMRARGAPVAELVAHGEDHFVIRDAGEELSALVLDAPEGPSARRCLAAAGRALAELHARGLAHGRPYLRDICWQEATRRITFIDVERGARLSARPGRQARDVGLLVLSIFALLPDARGAALADAFLGTYLAAAPSAMRGACHRFARRWRWLSVATAPMRWHEMHFRQDRRWKEYSALPLALARLRRA